MKRFSLCSLIVLVAVLQLKAQNSASVTNFNKDWQFVKDIDTSGSPQSLSAVKYNGIDWEKVSLPHTAHGEPINKIKEQWQGTCFYRKFFTIPASDKGKHIAIKLDAAMDDA